MSDDEEALNDAWGLAIHEALSADPDGWWDRVSAHQRIERDDPTPGFVDGESADVGRALRRAGWTPPPGAVERWQQAMSEARAGSPA